MSANRIDAKDRSCATRTHKNARYIRSIASHLIQNKEVTSIIPADTLAKLHTISDPHKVIKNKELATLLEKNKIPSIKNMVSGPLFNGWIYFVRITFNTPSGAISISNSDMLTAINYTQRAVIPISLYASQYGPNSLNVSNNIIEYSVSPTPWQGWNELYNLGLYWFQLFWNPRSHYGEL
jgi:hypothetical protein